MEFNLPFRPLNDGTESGSAFPFSSLSLPLRPSQQEDGVRLAHLLPQHHHRLSPYSQLLPSDPAAISRPTRRSVIWNRSRRIDGVSWKLRRSGRTRRSAYWGNFLEHCVTPDLQPRRIEGGHRLTVHEPDEAPIPVTQWVEPLLRCLVRLAQATPDYLAYAQRLMRYQVTDRWNGDEPQLSEELRYARELLVQDVRAILIYVKDVEIGADVKPGACSVCGDSDDAEAQPEPIL
ncbi:hypothetical protein M501DRAFT_986303 [Patellaria atrata CBS 101060]|uniref:Uncharacterized protein n=1 Tax=Patellaria atrata CBS 101060 TaxID=1346257 RepID=A0A9P4S7W6_9PEZI|nr:hypothetical protein M501DRAFT_986303 [Patellaria atrata CBS 101060]